MNDILESQIPISKESISKIKKLRNEAHKLISHLRNGRTIIIIISLFNLLFLFLELSSYNENPTDESFIRTVFWGSTFFIYAICIIFFKKIPTIALVFAFINYSAIFSLNTFLGESDLSSGIIVRIIISIAFIIDIISSVKLPKVMAELKKYDLPPEWFSLAKELKDLPFAKSLIIKK